MRLRYTGGFRKAEHFGKKLYVLALKRGLKTALQLRILRKNGEWHKFWNNRRRAA